MLPAGVEISRNPIVKRNTSGSWGETPPGMIVQQDKGFMSPRVSFMIMISRVSTEWIPLIHLYCRQHDLPLAQKLNEHSLEIQSKILYMTKFFVSDFIQKLKDDKLVNGSQQPLDFGLAILF